MKAKFFFMFGAQVLPPALKSSYNMPFLCDAIRVQIPSQLTSEFITHQNSWFFIDRVVGKETRGLMCEPLSLDVKEGN